MVVHVHGSTHRIVCRNGTGYRTWVKCGIDTISASYAEVGAGTYGYDGYHDFRQPRGVYLA